jgi:hypothetical protein
MSDREFARLAERVRALTGIVLPPHKRQLVISRLRKRLRALGIDGFRAYLAYLDSPDDAAETGEMVNAVTTNQTAFFREGHHFEDMARMLARHPGDVGGRPRRWPGRGRRPTRPNGSTPARGNYAGTISRPFPTAGSGSPPAPAS